MEEKKFYLPSGWPTDKRSRIVKTIAGILLHHPERDSMVWAGTSWSKFRDEAMSS